MSIIAATAAIVDTAKTVKGALTGAGLPVGRRKGGAVENREFVGFARRIIRAFARRVADGDVEALRDLVNLRHNLDAAIDDAVIGLRAHNYSWSEIADRLGTTKQAAWSRWHVVCDDLAGTAIERDLAQMEPVAA